MSVALEVCRLTESRLPSDPAVRLVTVGVEVGDDSGLELANLRFCLEALLTEPPFNGARPDLIAMPGTDLRLAYLEVDDGSPNH